MKIAVEGCAHGELEIIYDTIASLEETTGFKVDLLICCGDFQTTRNENDLRCMAVPPKYYNMCSFYKYYSGEKVAPILTVLIGGNHEASNYLQELPYGGWVAPNIYYMGYAGVINIAGVRIGGISGIYKGKDYMKGRYEKTPYDENTKRSVYHIRNVDVFRLKQLSEPMDVFISHDWPTNVTDFGNAGQLIRFKPHFKDDINNGVLGSKPSEELLSSLKPSYWFAAHLHCKFAALIPHDDEKATKFLALDKCLPRRRFLQLFDFEQKNEEIAIEYDLEWLTILLLTNHLTSFKNITNYMPGPNGSERYDYKPTEEEKSFVLLKFENNLKVPLNFVKTAPAFTGGTPKKQAQQPQPVQNPQTIEFCKRLGIDDPLELLLENQNISFDSSFTNDDSLNDSQKTLNFSTFIEDTDVSNCASPSPVKRKSEENVSTPRQSLSLPPPKNSESETDCKEFGEKNKQEEILETKSEEEQKNEVEPIDKVEPEVPTQEIPVVKKFKRRNADMYQNDD